MKTLLVSVCVFIITATSAQVNIDSVFKANNAVILFTKQGTELSGIVGHVHDSTVVLRKGIKDSVSVHVRDVARAYITDENNFFKGKYIYPNIFSPFNFTFATAFPVPRKTILIRANFFGLSSVHFPVMKNLAMSYATTVGGIPVSVNLRYSLKAATHLYIAPEAGINSGSWIAPEVWMWNAGVRASQGNSQQSVTIGAGYFQLSGLKRLSNQLKRKYEGVCIHAGVQQRVSRKVSLVGDAWYISSPKVVAIGVFTRHHRRELSLWSFGVLGVYFRADGERFLLPVPMVQWATRF